MARHFPAVVFLVLPLVACATMPPPGPPPMDYQCVADAASWAMGLGISEEITERVRRETNSQTVRVIRPGQAVTMDFRGDRVNIKLNERDAIVGVSCG